MDLMYDLKLNVMGQDVAVQLAFKVRVRVRVRV